MDEKSTREQIAQCRKYADDQNMCGVDVGRSGPCHADWFWDEVANTMQSLLDELTAAREVAEAANAFLRAEWMVTHDWGGDRDAVYDALEEALANYQKVKGE